MEDVCADLAERGHAAWNVEYRRVGAGGGWPQTLEDVAAAVEALQDVPAVDADRVGAVGHSAGGQLALWAAARGGIRAVVSQAGVADLVLAASTPPSDEPTRALIGGGPDEYPDRYTAASPAASPPRGIPQLVLHGELDDVVAIDISRSYVAAAGDDAQLSVLPATGHYEHIDPATDAWRTARDWLAARL